ncbi:hypothetical protein HKBW3S42_00185 [Candidatus Hakubella thermalkaliphila]|uniref:Uncharacterized protein n=1 Tax=Candidatus Hakubella thermalkaliphila TaxID=2754717 RepID=A0A6V8QCJ9_9ACTN|nr:hypothetical protein HKBW3S42_00185 [Candidatus Hakubella thermalkaliphila]GFP42383.1 hypothetical protein HKBW3C_01509 [Candidatus Hakubella thermalkaliphila]
MKELESLWKETKEKFDQLEKSLVDCYIAFLREVARVYLQQSRRMPANQPHALKAVKKFKMILTMIRS